LQWELYHQSLEPAHPYPESLRIWAREILGYFSNNNRNKISLLSSLPPYSPFQFWDSFDVWIPCSLQCPRNLKFCILIDKILLETMMKVCRFFLSLKQARLIEDFWKFQKTQQLLWFMKSHIKFAWQNLRK
jgi:hypothetical protein